jgi:hypothetical protein
MIHYIGFGVRDLGFSESHSTPVVDIAHGEVSFSRRLGVRLPVECDLRLLRAPSIALA